MLLAILGSKLVGPDRASSTENALWA